MKSYVQLNSDYRMANITWDMLTKAQKEELKNAYLDVMEIESHKVDDRIKIDLKPVPPAKYHNPMKELFESINNMNRQFYAKRWGIA